MEFVYNAVLVLHFLGLASLVGGCLVQMSGRGERVVNAAMTHGALTQVVTGVIMVGLAEAVDSLEREVDTQKIAAKLIVALVVAVLCWVNRKKSPIPDGLYFLVFGLSVGNIVIAVFWS